MNQRKIEVFTAGCPCCDEAVELVRRAACPSCEIEILDMHLPGPQLRAKGYGVKSVPAVAIDGKLAGCCSGRGVDGASLAAAGLGLPR